MHGSLPPLEISGPGEPHALDGLPIQIRPDFGHHLCGHCMGRGAWNELFYLDSGRCRLHDCDECDGYGWLTADGHHVKLDIVMIDGRPTWVVINLPLETPNANN